MKKAINHSGSDTKAEALRVAVALFTTKGFEATSLREIAEQLGISKAALYYHFKSKDDIVRSAVATRGNEAAELLTWARKQKPGPDLLERAVLRWVDAASVNKLRGIRFVTANPAVMRNISGSNHDGVIIDSLSAVAELVAGKNKDCTRQLLVKMAFLSINSAVMAASGTQRTDEEIVAAAREMALALLERLRER
jgi:AcrR family transcriptional regulator